MPDNTITTVDGLELRLHPVSPLLINKLRLAIEREFRDRGEPLDPPVYTVETVAGETETHTHNETTLKTDEDKAAWAAHQEAQLRYLSALNARITRVVLEWGIEWDGQVPESWVARMKRTGIELPDDPDELAYEYMTMAILSTQQDISHTAAQIMRLSAAGAPEEAVKAAEAMFRRPVAGPAPEEPVTA